MQFSQFTRGAFKKDLAILYISPITQTIWQQASRVFDDLFNNSRDTRLVVILEQWWYNIDRLKFQWKLFHQKCKSFSKGTISMKIIIYIFPKDSIYFHNAITLQIATCSNTVFRSVTKIVNKNCPFYSIPCKIRTKYKKADPTWIPILPFNFQFRIPSLKNAIKKKYILNKLKPSYITNNKLSWNLRGNFPIFFWITKTFLKKSERALSNNRNREDRLYEILQEKIARKRTKFSSPFLERDQSERLRRRLIINQRESWRKGNRNARVSQPPPPPSEQ